MSQIQHSELRESNLSRVHEFLNPLVPVFDSYKSKKKGKKKSALRNAYSFQSMKGSH